MKNETLFIKTVIQLDKLGIPPAESADTLREYFFIDKDRSSKLISKLADETYSKLADYDALKILQTWELCFGSNLDTADDEILLSAFKEALSELERIKQELHVTEITLRDINKLIRYDDICKYIVGLCYCCGFKLQADLNNGLALLEQSSHFAAKVVLAWHKTESVAEIFKSLASSPECIFDMQTVRFFADKYGVELTEMPVASKKMGF